MADLAAKKKCVPLYCAAELHQPLADWPAQLTFQMALYSCICLCNLHHKYDDIT